MAALAGMDERPVVRTKGGLVSRGAPSAVDLLSRRGVPLPEPEAVERPEPPPPPPAPWEPVEPTGVDLVDLRRELQAARAKGVLFDVAWPLARQRVAARVPTAFGYKSPRRLFLAATAATREHWKHAYYRVGEPPRFVGALLTLFDDVDDDTVAGRPRRVRTSEW